MFGNVTGGTHRGAAYDGLTLMSLGLDTGKAFGWEGGTFNVSAFQIHGRNLSADNLQTLQTASGIEAQRSTRLWELWYQQSFLDGTARRQDRPAEPRPGVHRQPVFRACSSTRDGLAAGPVGRPVCRRPRLSAVLARRAPARAADQQPHRAGAACSTTTRRAARSTTTARCAAPRSPARGSTRNTGALVIGEVQYAINPPVAGRDGRRQRAAGCPASTSSASGTTPASSTTSASTPTGLSLADPTSQRQSAQPRRHNYSIYGVFDQMVWRPDPDGPQAVGIFARVMGAPGRPQPGQFQRQCRHRAEGAVAGPRQRHRRPRLRLRQDQPERHQAATRTINAFSGPVSGPLERELHRADLPVPGRAVVDAAAGLPIRVHARRRHPEPAAAQPAHRQLGRSFGLRTNIMLLTACGAAPHTMIKRHAMRPAPPLLRCSPRLGAAARGAARRQPQGFLETIKRHTR